MICFVAIIIIIMIVIILNEPEKLFAFHIALAHNQSTITDATTRYLLGTLTTTTQTNGMRKMKQNIIYENSGTFK